MSSALKRGWKVIAFLGAVLALNGRITPVLSEVSTGSWIALAVFAVLVLVVGAKLKRQGRMYRNLN
jgi:hypothetical protein